MRRRTLLNLGAEFNVEPKTRRGQQTKVRRLEFKPEETCLCLWSAGRQAKEDAILQRREHF